MHQASRCHRRADDLAATRDQVPVELLVVADEGHGIARMEADTALVR